MTDRFTDWDFARRTLIVIALGAAALLLWRLSYVAVLIFAAVLVGVLISAAGRRLAGWTGLCYTWAVVIAALGTIGLMGLFIWLVWGQLYQQIAAVLGALPDTIDAVAGTLGMPIELDPGKMVDQLAPDLIDPGMVGNVARYGINAFSSVIELLLVIGAGVFFALDPALYRRGTLLLFPAAQRAGVAKAMDSIAHALSGWFVGQLIVMVAVGAMSFAAYSLIGLPSATALAVIAGVLNFVPMLGPFLAGAIAVLTAVPVGLETILWTLAAAIAIQEIESLVLVPRVQQWTVQVPAVVVIFSLAVFGTLFGVIGVLLAVPLALTVLVAVQELWLKDTLGEQVEVAGA